MFNVGDLDLASAGNLLTNIASVGNRLFNGDYTIMDIEDPQLAFMWEVEIINPYITSDTGKIKLYAQSANIPSRNIEVLPRYFAGVPYSFHGRDTSPREFRLNMFDNRDFEMSKLFEKWYQLMQYGDDLKSSSPENYMFDIILRMLDHDGKSTNRFYRFKKAFPSEIGEVQLSYDSSEMMRFDVAFNFQSREEI